MNAGKYNKKILISNNDKTPFTPVFLGEDFQCSRKNLYEKNIMEWTGRERERERERERVGKKCLHASVV